MTYTPSPEAVEAAERAIHARRCHYAETGFQCNHEPTAAERTVALADATAALTAAGPLIAAGALRPQPLHEGEHHMTGIIYTKMTLRDLIAALRALPGEARVRGFAPDIHSYRGYYERNAVQPSDMEMSAELMADSLEDQEGKDITGWRGGDYRVSLDKGIYLAPEGDTGPCFAGIFPVGNGIYEPVLVHDGRVW